VIEQREEVVENLLGARFRNKSDAIKNLEVSVVA
jgi:hypothetical protein